MKILSKDSIFYFLKYSNISKSGLSALFVPLLCLNSSMVFSAAGDVISNTATIDFVYQSIPLILESSPTGNTQTGIGNGTATSFQEDRLINFSVVSVDAAAVNVSSLQSAAFLSFTVTNSGNAPQDFLLTAINTSPISITSPGLMDLSKSRIIPLIKLLTTFCNPKPIPTPSAPPKTARVVSSMPALCKATRIIME